MGAKQSTAKVELWPRAERQLWAIEPEYRTLAARRPFNASATMALFRH
jgi:hypothetical protein